MQTDRSQGLSLSSVFVCGVVTGTMVSFVESPFDLFKAKLQVQYAGQEKKYNNAIDAARKLAASNGMRYEISARVGDFPSCYADLLVSHMLTLSRGIFQGLHATIIRNVPGNAAYFGVYEFAKQMVRAAVLQSPLSLSLSNMTLFVVVVVAAWWWLWQASEHSSGAHSWRYRRHGLLVRDCCSTLLFL